jgi:hypothetical protein
MRLLSITAASSQSRVVLVVFECGTNLSVTCSAVRYLPVQVMSRLHTRGTEVNLTKVGILRIRGVFVEAVDLLWVSLLQRDTDRHITALCACDCFVHSASSTFRFPLTVYGVVGEAAAGLLRSSQIQTETRIFPEMARKNYMISRTLELLGIPWD